MSDETTTAVVVDEPVSDAVTDFVALTPYEMKAAHGGMLQWAEGKVREMKAEIKELQEEVDLAKQNKWRSGGFERHRKLAEKRCRFYEKIVEALKAGFIVVPNFAMDAFAIRTKATSPSGGAREGHAWGPPSPSNFVQPAQALPAGEGQYRNPVPSTETWTREVPQKDGTAISKWFARPDEFMDVVFPVAVAKPLVMSATAHAMSFRIFDEVGMTTEWNNSRRGDPIVLGRIRNPWPGHPDMSFFIGWYMDVSRI